MDGTIISIAGASLGVILFLLGYRFGNTAGFVAGAQYGIAKSEDSFMKIIDKWVKDATPVADGPPPKMNLQQQEIDFLHANIAALDKTISEMNNPEDAVNKSSLESQRDSFKEILDQDAKEKADGNVRS
jgi:hypothetical protein